MIRLTTAQDQACQSKKGLGATGDAALPRSRVVLYASGANPTRGRALWRVALGLAFLAAFVLPVGARLSSPLPRSEYVLSVWNVVDGLPENSATAIVQSRSGHLWFGTFEGLVRFDGLRMRVFNPANTPELPSGGIVHLHLCPNDQLLVSTYRGLVAHEGGVWRSVRKPDGTALSPVRTFSGRANGDVLMTTFDGEVYEYSGGALAPLPPPPGEKGQGYFGGADEEGHWWVVQNRFIGRLENGRWRTTLSPPDLPRDALGCAPARHGGLWLLLGDELLELRGGVEIKRTKLPERPGGVWSLYEDSQGNVWIVSYNQGFCRVTPRAIFSRWRAVDGVPDSGRCVFEDRERNLWLGTAGDGLCRLTRQRFQHFNMGGEEVRVHSVAKDPHGGVWAATFGRGLFNLDSDGVAEHRSFGVTNVPVYLQSVLADRTGRLWISGMAVPLLLKDSDGVHSLAGSANNIALFEDSSGRIWITAGGGAVYRSDRTHVEAFGAEAGLPQDAATCLAQDASGALWVASPSGVFRRSGDGGFTEVRNASGASIRSILCLKGDRDGSVWLGSADRGLLRWRDGAIKVLDAHSGFPVARVDGIVEDDRRAFWMTSRQQIVRAEATNLHAVAEGRISRLICQVFDHADGLGNREFVSGRQPSCTKDIRGRLWFATTKGVDMIDPAALRLNDQPPPVLVEELAYSGPGFAGTSDRTGGGRSRGQRSTVRGPFAGPVILPPGSRHLEIQYSALSLSAPEKVRYQVMLEGADSQWTEAPQPPTTSFYELPPGNYVFRVRAANNDGVWNESGARLAFTVLPFYWQTGWFRLGAGLLLVALGGISVWSWAHRRITRAQARERAAQDLAKAEQETRELRENLMHLARVNTLGALSGSLAHELNQPLGIILTNAQAAQELLVQTQPDVAEVQAILTDIVAADRRAGEVIQRLRALLKHGQISRQPLSLNEVIEEVLRLTRADLIRREVTVVCDLAPDLPKIAGDRVQLQQLLLNLILNAAEAMVANAPGARRVHLQTALRERHVRASVRDEGSGLPAEVERLFQPFYTTKPQGLGMGLAICRSIIAAHGGRLWAESPAQGGAIFHFELPVAEKG